MRAVIADPPGGPEALRLVEVPDPEPGPGEVLLRVRAAGVNRADLLQRMGLYPPPPGASPIIGLEAAGEIEAVGSAVIDWGEGDRAMALLAGGGYGEKVAVPAGQLLPIPANIDTISAGGIPEVFITSHNNLLTRGRLERGETVLIHGGASGVGTAAIQIARLAGARVIVTAGSAERVERCRELGAHHGINYKDEDFVARVHEITGGRGADVILDIMGAAYLERNLEALAPDGRLVMIGMQGGVRAEIGLNTLITKRLTVMAASLRGRPADQKAAVVHRAIEDLLPALADGSLRPVIDRVVPLDQAAEAHRALESGEVFGKVVLAS